VKSDWWAFTVTVATALLIGKVLFPGTCPQILDRFEVVDFAFGTIGPWS